MKEIKITDKISIYSIKIEYNKEQILKEAKLNFDANALTAESTQETPGIQSSLIINADEIDRIREVGLKILGEELKCNINKPYYHDTWLYKSDNKNIYDGYHTHNSPNGTNLKNVEWTYTFYIQMPDNLEGDDGYLFFKTKDNIEYKILPNEGDMLLFPASLAHTAKPNTKSKMERIVLASSFKSLNLNNSIFKEQKSLI